METHGFIKLSRKTFNHPIWKEERVYSRFEAWLDLIQSAKIEDGGIMFNGNLIKVRRAEVFISLRYLAERWKWSKNTVDRYLKVLDENSMIKLRRDKGATIVTLTNFELYNSRGTSVGNDRDKQGTSVGQSIRSKEIKNEIMKYKKLYKKSPPSDFFDSKILEIENYEEDDKEEIIEFLQKEKEKSSAKKEKEIPTIQEFIAYGKEKKGDVSEQALELKYKSWVENDWRTGKGIDIKNWKVTLLNTLAYLPTKNTQNGNTENKPRKPDTIGGIDIASYASFHGKSTDELLGSTTNAG